MTTNTLTGTVQSGGTNISRPLAGVLVTVYGIIDGIPFAVGTDTTDSKGNFSIVPSTSTSDSIFYATANIGEHVNLVTIIGPSLLDAITINELTTVAAAFSCAQFTHNGKIGGNAFGLGLAAGMNNNICSPVTGESSDVLTSSPNADETNSLRSTHALANLLAVSVLAAEADTKAAIAELFHLTTPPDGTPPIDTLQAFVNIALNPANNVAAIYAGAQDPDVKLYLPTLERMPDAWTIAVKVNDTGDPSLPFGGPGNVAFDDNGYAWITNNVVQGLPTSTNCIIVLQPNGKPADGTNSTPKSPITGGGILGTGFGVTIDPGGNVWVGNFGWGGDEPTREPSGNGSVSEFKADGEAVSGSLGYHSGTYRAQTVASDKGGNIWIASFGNNRVVVFPNGDSTSPFWFPQEPEPGPKGTFGIAIADDGSAWVTNSGDLTVHGKSGIGRYAIDEGQLVQLFFRDLGHSLKGLALDSQGNVWLASGGDNAVYLLSPEGELLGKFNGGGVSSPWSVTVDGDDHVWVANFGPMGPGANYTSASVSKLAGTNPGTLPPRHKTGDPISPSTGYTLPSAGSPITLNSGEPLYGTGSPPSFTPLTRMTNCCIDQAGNVWALNNWKPNFDIAAVPKVGNPGGDGIVIFVGLAKPPRRKHLTLPKPA